LITGSVKLSYLGEDKYYSLFCKERIIIIKEKEKRNKNKADQPSIPRTKLVHYFTFLKNFLLK